MIDLKFIQFYVESLYEKSVEEYFHVERSTVSNWRKRGTPKRYILTFIDKEKSDNVFELFEKIYKK
jgi:transposase-like protein